MYLDQPKFQFAQSKFQFAQEIFQFGILFQAKFQFAQGFQENQVLQDRVFSRHGLVWDCRPTINLKQTEILPEKVYQTEKFPEQTEILTEQTEILVDQDT